MVSISLFLAFIWDQRKQQDYYYYIPSFELLRRHTVYRISLNTHLFEYSYMARENKHYVAKFLILIIVLPESKYHRIRLTKTYLSLLFLIGFLVP